MRQLFTIIGFFLFLILGNAQGDNTAPYTIKQLPTGKIQVSFKPSATYPNMTASNFSVMLPPATSITSPTYFLGTLPVPGGGPTEYGSANFTAGPFTSGVEYPLMTFSYTSTATPGTTGAFTVINDGTNYIELGGQDRSGPPINLANAVVLPIKISKFDVRPFGGGGKASDLRWTSSSEVNASHFEVERSVDGFNFIYVDRVKATGNSNWAIDYNYVDRSLPTNRSGEEIYYYRLNMVDLDGAAELSDVRSVRFDNNDDVIVKMGPNPTSNIVFVNMSAPSATDADAPARVFDASGKLVTSKKVSTNGVTEIDLNNYPNAIYNISIEHNGKTYNNRIIKSN
jgi:hypothetical protein